MRPHRNRRGVAAVEAALVIPAVVVLAIGVADWGLALEQKLRLQTAARAGAQFAMSRPADSDGITAAARGAAPAFANLVVSPTPNRLCQCVTVVSGVESGRTDMASCTASCTGTGTRVVGYVTVRVERSITPITPLGPRSVSASATVQFQ
jgi:Flp pilus assembly protein TadG